MLSTGWPLSRQCEILWQFPDGSWHSSAAVGMLSVTHIMPVLVLNTCMDANMQFTINSFRQLFHEIFFHWHFPVISLIFSKNPNIISLTAVKFPDIPGFPDKWSPCKHYFLDTQNEIWIDQQSRQANLWPFLRQHIKQLILDISLNDNLIIAGHWTAACKPSSEELARNLQINFFNTTDENDFSTVNKYIFKYLHTKYYYYSL